MTIIIIGPFMLLSIPIRFFIGKEFALVFIDELNNKSISSKIDHLKEHKTQNNKVYSHLMINELNPGYYELVRMPYMKMKNAHYFLFVLGFFMINLILAYPAIEYFKSVYGIDGYTFNYDEYVVSFILVGNFAVVASVVSPLMMYVVPGYLYYRVCIEFNIEEFY